MTNGQAPKVMVAVHGVGDQLTNETIRSVTAQVCRYYECGGAMPLGAYTGVDAGRSFIIPLPKGVPPYIGFAEVYWAGIARRVATGGYVLEDARAWAKTIVARVQASVAEAGTGAGTGMSEKDCLLVENVLEELIDTVKVVDRLCFIASKAGLFTVNLQRVLDHFVNDVQLVADFQTYRDEILGTFHKAMGLVHKQHKDADIYVVAHSEGTVVALAGLLSAIGNPGGVAVAASDDGKSPAIHHREWLDCVRGFMTIGSPLDTHMLLWRPLWTPLAPKAGRWTTDRPIPWHNYYDRGDPIADSLKTTKQWLGTYCPGAFDVKVDQGFSRFLFPGKAHVDYWHDDHVFGHFIEEVTGLPVGWPPPAVGPAPMPQAVLAAQPSAKKPPERRYLKPPESKPWPQIFSYFAPYGLIALLSYTAVFILYKVVTDYLQNKPGPAIWRDVLTLAFLLVGMTIAVRIPRLSSMWGWRVFGFVLFALAAVGYAWPIWAFKPGDHLYYLRGMQDKIASEVFARFGVPAPFDVWALIIGAVAVVLVSMAFGRSKYNRVGVRILLGTGGVLVAIIVFGLIHKVMVESKVAAEKAAGESRVAAQSPTKQPAAAQPAPPDRALWPVFVAAAAFFYLWWLTALLFDLVFVWHRYIRHSAAVADLRELQAPKAAAAGAKTA
jgi:hypothetical protein